MKAALLILAMGGFCASAFAANLPTTGPDATVPVEQYTYSTHLDIAKVISTTPIPDVCGVVPARMDYVDSKGIEHVLEYRVMGNGCMDG
ncbi:MAG: hypothetical protein JWR17_196 [Pseudomonas sp.]|jgi:hypothetical protein|uniref:DUF2790 domain-containing protein n=1 Tax=Pseudomonas sp. TaxID=306 RepID=UPI00262B442B|nr:DUF2790 domain-containing protein [Pseudomonas sp.]MDB6047450.1 hypothetical protein [Pseudomonas sp.]